MHLCDTLRYQILRMLCKGGHELAMEMLEHHGYDRFVANQLIHITEAGIVR